MSRHVLTLSASNRAKAHQGINAAPSGWILELREPKRTDAQNAALHGLIGQIIKQRPTHFGLRMSMETYKAMFMQALGAEMVFVPTIDGTGMFPMGHKTSALTKGEFAGLLELILAWCAQEGLTVEHFDERVAA